MARRRRGDEAPAVVELPVELDRFTVEHWVDPEVFVPTSSDLSEEELFWEVYSVAVHRRESAFVAWSRQTGIPVGRAGMDPLRRSTYPTFVDADRFFAVLARRGGR